MNIAKYFASIGFDLDLASIKKVDDTLDLFEKRLKNFGGFSVDQRKMNVALGNALDLASTKLTFEISRFSVNQAALNRDVSNAMMRASNSSALIVNPKLHQSNPTARTSHVAGAVGGGLIGRGVSGFYGPALALGLGGYGLSQLNQRNQQVVSAQLQTSAVVQQAMGDSYTPEAGRGSFEWLKSQANETGFNYLDAVPSYNKLLSGVTGAGMSVQQGQGIFKGFSRLARVMKLDKVQQGRLFKGLSDVAGKDQLMSEELTGQLAEVLPGAVSLFAEAYQKQIGGKLTGSEATKALRKAMKDRKVTGSILTVAGDIAAQRAAPGYEAAKTASQAEQARYQNSISDLAVVASDSGVEEGFARIFRTLAAGLNESGDLVKRLAEGFNEATKWADDLLLFPQSFVRALEGKDSVVADWLGVDKTNQLKKDWSDIKQIFTDISTVKFDFLPTLEATAREIASIMNAIAEFQKWKSGSLPTSETSNSSTEKASLFGLEYASPAAIVGDIINNTGFNMNKARERGRAVYDDPTSPYYQDAAGYDSQQADMAKAAAEDKAMGIVNNSNQIDIVVNVDGSTLQGMDANAQAQAIGEAVANMFVQSFDQVNVQFPVKQ